MLRESPTDCITFRASNSASSSSKVATPKAEVSKNPLNPVALPPNKFSPTSANQLESSSGAKLVS